jgi:hypothetical protein
LPAAPGRRPARVRARNIAVAAAIAVTLAGRLEFALFATTYFITEAPLMLGAIIVFRRVSTPAASGLTCV